MKTSAINWAAGKINDFVFAYILLSPKKTGRKYRMNTWVLRSYFLCLLQSKGGGGGKRED